MSPLPLDIPEILPNIFEYLDDKLPAALVCKAWSNEALSLRWRQVAFHRLLALLPPLEKSYRSNNTLAWVFTRNIEAEDWVRFDKYSWMIHSLSVFTLTGFESETSDPLYPSFLVDIACTRPRPVLIPNLKRLRVVNECPLLHLLAHQGVKDLSVQFPHPPTDAFFHLITTKMPRLERLRLDIPMSPNHNSTGVLATMIQDLPSLRVLQLSPDWLTPNIISKLAMAPRLEGLQFPSLTVMPRVSDTLPMALPANSFPCLHSLHMVLPFECAVSYFSRLHKPRTIKNFLVLSPKVESTAQLRQLVDLLTALCPHIEELTACSPTCGMDSPVEWFTILKSIRGLANLRHLHIVHDTLQLLSLSDIISLGQQLHSIECLRLTPSSKSNSNPQLDITTLSVFVWLFPNLRALWLHLDAPASSLPCIEPGAKIPNLEFLGLFLRNSRANNPEGVASFLASILPEGCQVELLESLPAGWVTAAKMMRARGLRVTRKAMYPCSLPS